MKKVIVPSLIFSGLMCLMYVAAYRQVLPTTQVGLILLLVLFYGIVFFVLIRSIKNKYFKQNATFGVLFKHGFFLAVIATLLSSLFAFLYLSYIDKDALNRQKKTEQKVMQEQIENLGEDSTAFKRNMEDMYSLSESPKSVAFLNILNSLIMYSVFAFFSAAILKTRDKSPPE